MSQIATSQCHGVVLTRKQSGGILLDFTLPVPYHTLRRSRVLSDLQDDLEGEVRLPLHKRTLLQWMHYKGASEHDAGTLITVFQVADFLQDEAAQLTISLQLAAEMRSHIRSGFDASSALFPIILSSSTAPANSYTSRGCLDYLAATPQPASHAALIRLVSSLAGLSSAGLALVMGHLHPLERLHVAKVVVMASHEPSCQRFVSCSCRESQEVLVARPELRSSPLSPRKDYMRFSSPGMLWRNCIGDLFQALSRSQAAAPQATLTDAELTTGCPCERLCHLSICELDYALMARLQHLLRAPHVGSSLLSLQVAHVNTRPQFLRCLSHAAALTSLSLSHIWGLASAEDLQHSLSQLSNLRVLHLSQLHLSQSSNQAAATDEEQRLALLTPLSRLTAVRLACNDQTTCHSLYLPVFRALPLLSLKELAVCFNISKTGGLTRDISLWPADSQLTQLQCCAVWLHVLQGQRSALFERLVSFSCESVQKREESWPADPMAALPFPGTLPNSSWVMLQSMHALRELELSGLSSSEQLYALRNLGLSSSVRLQSLKLLHSAGCDGLADYLACPHVSLTSLCVSAHSMSDWQASGLSAVWQQLPRHSHLATLTWDMTELLGATGFQNHQRTRAIKHCLLCELQHLTGLLQLTKLVVCSVQALGGSAPGVCGTTANLLALPQLRILACHVGSHLCHELPAGAGNQLRAQCVVEDWRSRGQSLEPHAGEPSSAYAVSNCTKRAAEPQGKCSMLPVLEQLQLGIENDCCLNDVVRLLCAPGLVSRLRLLSLSNISTEPQYKVAAGRDRLTCLLEVIGNMANLEELRLHAAPTFQPSGVATAGCVGRDGRSVSASERQAEPALPRLPLYLKHLLRLQALVLNGFGCPEDVQELVRLGLPLQRGVVFM